MFWINNKVSKKTFHFIMKKAALLSKLTSQSRAVVATVKCPHNMIIQLETGNRAFTSYLLALSAAPHQNTMYELSPSILESGLPAAKLDVASPVHCPVSNPLKMFKSWSKNIFWEAPPHARPPASLPGGERPLLPEGKSWLDRDLRQVMQVAMPYLAIPTQVPAYPQ